ncbi:tetratricopeptide repeat protein [Clostridium sp.]|uniref:tetratricopeptide repeat protein n=1 Tax=Clostridium sp. TaxID=1506 RepID=UPI003216994C
MININKSYKKAMNYYCEGNLDKSLSCCDKILSIDRSHSPTLNLKGLIYYVRGDLEQAKFFWKLSYKLNRDMVSKKYLEDSRTDEGNKYIFSQGVLLFNEVKVREALKCFIKCEESNFNSINLWNYISKCYMKLGQHNKSIKYVNDVLELDRHNEEALKIKSQLVELGIISKNISEQIKKKFTLGFITIIVIVLLSVGIFKGYKLLEERSILKGGNENKSQDNINSNSDNFQGNIEESNNNVNDNTKENVESEEIKEGKASFKEKELKSYIDSEEYENIINYIELYKEDDLHINDKIVVQSGIDLIKTKGVPYLYEKGSNLIENEKYEEAIDSLKLAYEYSDGSYLNEHILFMIGVSYENIGNIENSNKYYELYVEKYLDTGSYTEQCLYSLAVSNAIVNVEKARTYAEIIEDKFNSSEYNNTKIKEILE